MNQLHYVGITYDNMYDLFNNMLIFFWLLYYIDGHYIRKMWIHAQCTVFLPMQLQVIPKIPATLQP
jgi:hypothetical protein